MRKGIPEIGENRWKSRRVRQKTESRSRRQNPSSRKDNLAKEAENPLNGLLPTLIELIQNPVTIIEVSSYTIKEAKEMIKELR